MKCGYFKLATQAKPFGTAIWIILVCILFLNSGCISYKRISSDNFVEKLHLQIKSEEFVEIYENANSNAKNLTPRNEFMDSIKSVVNKMKETDKSLNWRTDKNVLLSNGDISTNLYFVYRKMEKDGKKLDIRITLNYDFLLPEFYDLCVSPSDLSTIEFQTCVTNALTKI